ncbi:hypothetical protein [Streptomyces sp. NBC_00989]|uniref:hypothetical protein n=1 Tax=Streptomyces sp. NBC_00989 TaxID=2903705 RepID=UPI0038703F27|nr:hypothetical protein OG714_14770 [Streptomyces sp. NBC_00989]
MTIHLGRKAACRWSDRHLHINQRLGVPPQSRGSTSGANCPDIFELCDDHYALIGTERTEEVRRAHPEMRELAPSEIVVVVDRQTLIHAKPQIPGN